MAGKKGNSTTKKETPEQAIERLEDQILNECKRLATHQTSSARKINELTVELIKAEQAAG